MKLLFAFCPRWRIGKRLPVGDFPLNSPHRALHESPPTVDSKLRNAAFNNNGHAKFRQLFPYWNPLACCPQGGDSPLGNNFRHFGDLFHFMPFVSYHCVLGVFSSGCECINSHALYGPRNRWPLGDFHTLMFNFVQPASVNSRTQSSTSWLTCTHSLLT